jgi:AcrR family transcriptional regulator
VPRGVAIPEVREQLFRAAERVLARAGGPGLTSRAVTEEAGVAKGLLFNHFTDLDRFLAELVLDRAGAAGRQAAELTARAGTGDVAGNLADAAVTLLRSPLFALAGIVHTRPETLARLHASGAGRPHHVLGPAEAAFAAYLAAERARGRVPAGTDVEAVALALIGTLHYGVTTGRLDHTNAAAHVRGIVGLFHTPAI